MKSMLEVVVLLLWLFRSLCLVLGVVMDVVLAVEVVMVWQIFVPWPISCFIYAS